MRAVYTPGNIELQARRDRIDFGLAAPARRSIVQALQPLTADTLDSGHLFYSPVGVFEYDGYFYRLARYVFLGPASHDEPIKLALFAATYGDEPEGTRALVEFLRRLHRKPELARGFQIFAYPVSNPTGSRTTRAGHGTGMTCSLKFGTDRSSPRLISSSVNLAFCNSTGW